MADGARGRLRTILERVLIQESRLAATAHDFAWQVPGSPVQSLKRLVSEQGRQIDRWLGDLRGCARALGFAGGVAAPAQEEAAGVPRQDEMVAELLARHEAIVRELRQAVEAANERDPDGDAAALLSGLLDFHETSAWMLRLILNSPERRRIL